MKSTTFIEERHFLNSDPSDLSAVRVRIHMEWDDKYEFASGLLSISDGSEVVQFDLDCETGDGFRRSEEMLSTLIALLTETHNQLDEARSLFVQAEKREKQ
jgi:hypothetical protein